jgi:hypothetical protein
VSQPQFRKVSRNVHEVIIDGQVVGQVCYRTASWWPHDSAGQQVGVTGYGSGAAAAQQIPR